MNGRGGTGGGSPRVLIYVWAEIGEAVMWLLASLLCLTRLLAHIYCEEVFGVVGENVTFPVKIGEKVVEIRWTKSNGIVAEWEGQNKPKYFEHFGNRSVLMEDGSLTIINLKKNDADLYELQYWDSVRDHYLKFKLEVFDSFPGPKISCNTSGDNLVLNCTADFQRPLNYTWKLSNDSHSYQSQNLSFPLEKVNHITKATCVIKFSQIERSSEISLIQCLPDEKGDGSYKRNRGGLLAAVVLVIVAVGILVFILKKGIIKHETGGRTAQKNSPVNGSGACEPLFHGNSREQPNSEGAAFSQAAHCENEEPEADRKWNEEDSALKDKQTVNNGVDQEDTFKKSSSLLASHVDGHGINEGEVIQDPEGGNGEHLNSYSSCSKEDLKS